ncbi:acyltransferase family protein [Undibacterium sp. Xuan67W]|uniref:acyltransferase family protein n=1 Tax=Undibacterium sp. Xuan67W TaxID=3413057 RepID=UPI003BF198A7
MTHPHQHPNRLLALDGLRAVSILLVVISHAWLGHIVPGGLGVTIFFFISGFIITRLMIVEWDATTQINIRQFYLRRFFRLMPALIIYVVLSLLAMLAMGEAIKLIELLSVFFYYANYYAIYFGFGDDTLPAPLSITWSLAIEEHFYLVFPFLFAALAGKITWFLRLIAGLIVAVFLWRLYLLTQFGLEQLAHDRIYKGTDTRLDSILYGTGFSILLARYSWANKFFSDRRVVVSGALLMSLSLLVRNEIFRESLRYSIQGIALACLFCHLVFIDNPVQRLLSSGPMIYIGKISYSLYLYHYLIFTLITAWMPDSALWIRIATLLIASWICADLSYRYVEQYFARIGRRFLH